MSVKPEDLPPTDTLSETIDFFGKGAGPQPPATEGRHRYTFGSGARPLEGYTIKRAIGRGGFGEVYYATSDSGKEVALKLITRNLEIERRGVAQCMNLKCQNLLAIHDIKGNDDGDTFVIMEYVAGPNLAQVLADYPRGMPLPEVRAWLRGLVEGVSYLHDHGIVHRDLKPANLFMEEGVVKIGDYGLSKMITSERVSNHSESIGTCHYMAPEISTGKYNKPIDIYAIGVILYEMIVGQVPFDGETVGEVLIKHLTTRPDLSRLPEPFRAIVAQALAKDPAHRPSRVLDLLPPDDAPAVHDVRFIGDGKPAAPAADPRGMGPARPAAAAVPAPAPPPPARGRRHLPDHRRGAHPLYWPQHGAAPRRPPAAAPGARSGGPGARTARRIAASSSSRPPAASAWSPTRRCSPTTRSCRRTPCRSGGSGSASSPGRCSRPAVWSGVGALLAGASMQIDFARRPQDVGFLFGMTLLASWTTLIVGKFTEGHDLPPRTRRAGQLALGALLGVMAQALAGWLLVEPADRGADPGPVPRVRRRAGSGDLPGAGRVCHLLRDRRPGGRLVDPGGSRPAAEVPRAADRQGRADRADPQPAVLLARPASAGPADRAADVGRGPAGRPLERGGRPVLLGHPVPPAPGGLTGNRPAPGQ